MLTGILSYKIIKNLLSVLKKERKKWKNLYNKSYRINATTNIPKTVTPSVGCSSSGFTAKAGDKAEDQHSGSKSLQCINTTLIFIFKSLNLYTHTCI